MTAAQKKMKGEAITEAHPLPPFLPENAKVLMLGSFPPPKARWSMDFYYPNFQNDMWRIIGKVFFNDKDHFVMPNERRFDMEKVTTFCSTEGIALYDTAQKVRRLNADASDKFLEIVEATDIAAMLKELPDCRHIIVTGQKAAETLAATLSCAVPAVGETVFVEVLDKKICVWRMPSSSRAYPLNFEAKAKTYAEAFRQIEAHGRLCHVVF